MSIDHGKVLALAKKLAPLKAMPFEFDNGPAGDDQWCVCTKESNLTGCDMDKEDAELFAYAVNALAQPAEAVEGEDGELLNDLEAEALLAWPRGVEQRFVGAREQRIAKICKRAIAALAHGSAQGAVAWYVFADTEKWVTLDRSEADDQRAEGCQVRPLIFGDTHPQAAPAPESPSLKQIVPDKERGPEPDPDTGADRGTCCAHAYADGWNDCVDEVAKRVAVAAQASPAQVGGWKLVPVEPTEEMVVRGFESAPDEFFSPAEEWERYEAMSGCQQAAHCARLCWAAMLAAAPTQEGES